VIVATCRALKYHGGVAVADCRQGDVAALERGLPNLERHLHNVQEVYGLPCVVAINHFAHDTDAEIELLTRRVEALGARAVVARHWAEGGAGAEDLARAVVQACEQPNHFQFVYDEALPLWQKVEAIATKIYGAASITASAPVQERIERLQAEATGTSRSASPRRR
jgi:formate--tetrahydrofolate ligase